MNGSPRGRVLSMAGGLYQVETDGGSIECSLRGRLKCGELQVAAGDEVEVERLPDGSCRIERILPRHSKLSRKSSSGAREQVIAANVDQLAAVVALARPAPDFRLLDRLLVLAELNELPAFIVMNKIDLAAGSAESDLSGDDVTSEFEAYRAAGYALLPTSAREGDGVAELERRLVGHVTVLAGPSGAGKSSLLNRLLPEWELRTQRVSARVGRGRHTTVGSTFYPLPGGGYVADTPGLQYLELWQTEADELAAAFPEFEPALGNCRFNDCRHLREPGCAVRAAVEAGEASPARYDSYVVLFDEASESEW